MRPITRALVTGGAGFLGGRLVEELAASGCDVVVLDRTTDSALGPVDATLIHGDLADMDVGGIVGDGGFDAIFHLIGTPSVPESVEQPARDLRLNADTLLTVLEAARRADEPPLVVFVSSAAVYGESTRLPMPEDHPLVPVSPYGVSKLAGERYAEMYARMYDLPTLSVRPFSLYGPGQRKLAVYDLLVRLVGGEDPLVVHGVPHASRDFVYVEDAARMILRIAGSAPGRGEAYNIASGRLVTLRELATLLVEASETGATTLFTSLLRRGDPLHWQGDTALAGALGARATTPLEAGIRETAMWVAGVEAVVPVL
jgi:UDP-glucose 4-epimerase